MISVPVRNEDGSLKFEYTLNPEQAQALLEFAFNFLLAAGMSQTYGITVVDADDEEKPEHLN